MPSTYTVNLGIEKPATGEQSGTWGDTTNVNFDILDQAINGAERVTLTSAGSSGSPNALNITNGATSDGRNKWIEFYSSGDLGGSAYVQLVPNDAEKIVFIRNSLASSRSVLLFQGTYNSGRDLEIPAGVDMVVKFDGGGASAATVTDVYTKLRATEITTPTLTAGTADINGGTIDNSVIGGSTAAAVTGTTVVANTSLNIAGDGATVTGIKDEDDMSSNSPTKLATQQSIKAYVDSQVGTVDTWAEVLANGATSGSTNPEVTAGQALKTNTINETSAGSGVTIDSVLLKDDVVNATDIETSSISANDGTASATIANSTGVMTITSSVLTTADINAGTIDNSTIGGTTPAVGTFTQVNVDNITIDGTEIDLSSGDLTIDVAGDIILDADDEGKVNFKDGGTPYARIDNNGGTGLDVVSTISDGDIRFRGNDGGSTIEALSLDMSEAGAATFNSSITIPDWVYHSGDSNTYFGFPSGDEFKVVTANVGRLHIKGSESVWNEGGENVDFRVESGGDANALFVDGGTNSIGIGTGAPSSTYKLDVAGAVRSTANAPSFNLQESDASNQHWVFGSYAGTLALRDVTGGTYPLQIANSGVTTNALNILAGETVINDNSADRDFRVESDNNTHALFVDASNDRVSIRNSSEINSGALSVNGSITFNNQTAGTYNHASGFIDFTDGGDANLLRLHAGADPGEYSKIEISTNIAGIQSDAISVENTGPIVINQDSAAARDFRVESDSNTHMLFVDAGNNRVGIGDSAPNVALSVVTGGSNEQFHVESPTPGMKFIDSNLTTRCFTIGGENGNVAIHADPNTASSDSHILMKADGSTIARFDGDGLKFGTDTAAANALDDYEEGTWNPSLDNGAGDLSATNLAFNAEGKYTKIGRVIYCTGVVSSSGTVTGTASSPVNITGLPFTVSGNSVFGGVFVDDSPSYNKPSVRTTSGEFGGGTTIITLKKDGTNDETNFLTSDLATSGNANRFYISGFYMV